MDQDKLVAIKVWPTPQSLSELRSFHGLASFYRKFVPNFSTIATPLNELVKKVVEFKWEMMELCGDMKLHGQRKWMKE